MVLDKKQLTKEGDIPKMYNYDGVRFSIRDVMGDLGITDDGRLDIKNGRDRKDWKVNERGYLVNDFNDVVNKDG